MIKDSCFVGAVGYFVRKNTWSFKFEDHGWGNGYVCVTKGHPLYGKTVKQIEKKYPQIDVVGGITWAEGYQKSAKFAPEDAKGMWIIGFDTVHSFCREDIHDENFVRNQTHSLCLQIEKIGK